MSTPGYIRLFAATDESSLGLTALEYTRSLMRIAPVRLITTTGQLLGRWAALQSLLNSPMAGSWVNVVACDPARWTWVQTIPMPNRDVAGVAAFEDAEADE